MAHALTHSAAQSSCILSYDITQALSASQEKCCYFKLSGNELLRDGTRSCVSGILMLGGVPLRRASPASGHAHCLLIKTTAANTDYCGGPGERINVSENSFAV